MISRNLPLADRLRSRYVMFAGKPMFSNKGTVLRASDVHDAAQAITELWEALDAALDWPMDENGDQWCRSIHAKYAPNTGDAS